MQSARRVTVGARIAAVLLGVSLMAASPANAVRTINILESTHARCTAELNTVRKDLQGSGQYRNSFPCYQVQTHTRGTMWQAHVEYQD